MVFLSIFFDKKLNSLTPYTPGEQPKETKGLIKLNTNESPFPPSSKVIDAINEASKNLNLYSDPTCSRGVAATAAFYGVESQNVFLGNGSDEVLAFVFHGLCRDGAVFADITYGFYNVFASMFGVKQKIIPLGNDFLIDVDDYNGLKGTVFIANPNAPTGILLPLGEIEKLLAQDQNRLVVIDEAYIDFGGESAVNLVEKYNNLLVVQTFSKSRSLAGARLGFAIAEKSIIADLNRMKYSFNPYNVNSVSLAAAKAAMEDTEYFDECRRTIIKNREYITKELKSLGFCVLDSHANFVFVGKHPKIKAADYYGLLRDNNILVRYFGAERIDDFVRISIGTSEQMERLAEVTRIITDNFKTF